MPTRLAVAARTDVGRVRKLNEDAFLVADVAGEPRDLSQGMVRFEVGDRGALVALSDGMGGHAAGEVAAALTLATLHRALAERTSLVAMDQRVQQAVEQANTEVFEAGTAAQQRRKMGATLTAFLVNQTTGYVATIGDSRAYLLRAGEIRQITRDQSFAQAMLDKGAMTPEELDTSPMRNILLQAIGQKPNVEAAITAVSLRRRDCVLLCSDGLWGKVEQDTLRDTVLGAQSLDLAAQRLVDLANERGGEDNITVLLVGIGGDVPDPLRGERITRAMEVLTTFDMS